jgi:hypothetical protein
MCDHACRTHVVHAPQLVYQISLFHFLAVKSTVANKRGATVLYTVMDPEATVLYL